MATVPVLAGLDEAGRGPLAGPVTAAAVILAAGFDIQGLTDSKKIPAQRRLRLEVEIKNTALAWCVADATVAEIDELNILWATMLAMKRAVAGLRLEPQKVLVDGNRCPDIPHPCTAIVRGDATVGIISAASILAKCARDRTMNELHHRYPQYGFDQHKGYGTRQHKQAIEDFGVLPEHRRSFSPVANALQQHQQANNGI